MFRNGRWVSGRVSSVATALCIALPTLVVVASACVSLETQGPTTATEATEAATTTAVTTPGPTQTSAGVESTTQTTPSSALTTSTSMFVFEAELTPMTVGTLPTQWLRVENGSQHLRWEVGTWHGVVAGEASGGSYARANNSGAKASIGFWGTRVRLVSFTGPEMGRAKLTLDGGSPIYVDLYDVGGGSKIVWQSGVLQDEGHKLEIEWTGIKSPSATDTIITIDAVDVVGLLMI